MKRARAAAQVFLLIVIALAICGPFLSPHRYDQQFRDLPNALPSHDFPLGTDDLGRDRLARLMFATAVSAALAPGAALTSVAIALAFSLPAFTRSAAIRYGLSTLTTLTLSVPWIFPFIVLRSVLPLNTHPGVSVVLTFALIGVSGWAYPGRVLAAAIAEIAGSGWLLLARASGSPPWRIFRKQILPHLQHIAVAQFRVLIPVYVLSEAGLGMLGLGVAEPLPSWGSMLLELQYPDRIRANPSILVPLLLMMAVLVCFELLAHPAARPAEQDGKTRQQTDAPEANSISSTAADSVAADPTQTALRRNAA